MKVFEFLVLISTYCVCFNEKILKISAILQKTNDSLPQFLVNGDTNSSDLLEELSEDDNSSVLRENLGSKSFHKIPEKEFEFEETKRKKRSLKYHKKDSPYRFSLSPPINIKKNDKSILRRNSISDSYYTDNIDDDVINEHFIDSSDPEFRSSPILEERISIEPVSDKMIQDQRFIDFPVGDKIDKLIRNADNERKQFEQINSHIGSNSIFPSQNNFLRNAQNIIGFQPNGFISPQKKDVLLKTRNQNELVNSKKFLRKDIPSVSDNSNISPIQKNKDHLSDVFRSSSKKLKDFSSILFKKNHKADNMNFKHTLGVPFTNYKRNAYPEGSTSLLENKNIIKVINLNSSDSNDDIIIDYAKQYSGNKRLIADFSKGNAELIIYPLNNADYDGLISKRSDIPSIQTLHFENVFKAMIGDYGINRWVYFDLDKGAKRFDIPVNTSNIISKSTKNDEKKILNLKETTSNKPKNEDKKSLFKNSSMNEKVKSGKYVQDKEKTPQAFNDDVSQNHKSQKKNLHFSRKSGDLTNQNKKSNLNLPFKHKIIDVTNDDGDDDDDSFTPLVHVNRHPGQLTIKEETLYQQYMHNNQLTSIPIDARDKRNHIPNNAKNGNVLNKSLNFEHKKTINKKVLHGMYNNSSIFKRFEVPSLMDSSKYFQYFIDHPESVVREAAAVFKERGEMEKQEEELGKDKPNEQNLKDVSILQPLDALYHSDKFPKQPSLKDVIDNFDAPTQVGYHYGQLLWGWFLAPMDGEYIFYSACDDACDIYLSPNERKDHIKKIIAQKQWSHHNEFDKYPEEQTSIGIRLGKSKLYFVQAVGAQSIGSDCLSLGVQLPNGVLIRPISREYMLTSPKAPTSGSNLEEANILDRNAVVSDNVTQQLALLMMGSDENLSNNINSDWISNISKETEGKQVLQEKNKENSFSNKEPEVLSKNYDNDAVSKNIEKLKEVVAIFANKINYKQIALERAKQTVMINSTISRLNKAIEAISSKIESIAQNQPVKYVNENKSTNQNNLESLSLSGGTLEESEENNGLKGSLLEGNQDNKLVHPSFYNPQNLMKFESILINLTNKIDSVAEKVGLSKTTQIPANKLKKPFINKNGSEKKVMNMNNAINKLVLEIEKLNAIDNDDVSSFIKKEETLLGLLNVLMSVRNSLNPIQQVITNNPILQTFTSDFSALDVILAVKRVNQDLNTLKNTLKATGILETERGKAILSLISKTTPDLSFRPSTATSDEVSKNKFPTFSFVNGIQDIVPLLLKPEASKFGSFLHGQLESVMHPENTATLPTGNEAPLSLILDNQSINSNLSPAIVNAGVVANKGIRGEDFGNPSSYNLGVGLDHSMQIPQNTGKLTTPILSPLLNDISVFSVNKQTPDLPILNSKEHADILYKSNDNFQRSSLTLLPKTLQMSVSSAGFIPDVNFAEVLLPENSYTPLYENSQQHKMNATNFVQLLTDKSQEKNKANKRFSKIQNHVQQSSIEAKKRSSKPFVEVIKNFGNKYKKEVKKSFMNNNLKNATLDRKYFQVHGQVSSETEKPAKKTRTASKNEEYDPKKKYSSDDVDDDVDWNKEYERREQKEDEELQQQEDRDHELENREENQLDNYLNREEENDYTYMYKKKKSPLNVLQKTLKNKSEIGVKRANGYWHNPENLHNDKEITEYENHMTALDKKRRHSHALYLEKQDEEIDSEEDKRLDEALDKEMAEDGYFHHHNHQKHHHNRNQYDGYNENKDIISTPKKGKLSQKQYRSLRLKYHGLHQPDLTKRGHVVLIDPEELKKILQNADLTSKLTSRINDQKEASIQPSPQINKVYDKEFLKASIRNSTLPFKRDQDSKDSESDKSILKVKSKDDIVDKNKNEFTQGLNSSTAAFNAMTSHSTSTFDVMKTEIAKAIASEIAARIISKDSVLFNTIETVAKPSINIAEAVSNAISRNEVASIPHSFKSSFHDLIKEVINQSLSSDIGSAIPSAKFENTSDQLAKSLNLTGKIDTPNMTSGYDKDKSMMLSDVIKPNEVTMLNKFLTQPAKLQEISSKMSSHVIVPNSSRLPHSTSHHLIFKSVQSSESKNEPHDDLSQSASIIPGYHQIINKKKEKKQTPEVISIGAVIRHNILGNIKSDTHSMFKSRRNNFPEVRSVIISNVPKKKRIQKLKKKVIKLTLKHKDFSLGKKAGYTQNFKKSAIFHHSQKPVSALIDDVDDDSDLVSGDSSNIDSPANSVVFSNFFKVSNGLGKLYDRSSISPLNATKFGGESFSGEFSDILDRFSNVIDDTSNKNYSQSNNNKKNGVSFSGNDDDILFSNVELNVIYGDKKNDKKVNITEQKNTWNFVNSKLNNTDFTNNQNKNTSSFLRNKSLISTTTYGNGDKAVTYTTETKNGKTKMTKTINYRNGEPIDRWTNGRIKIKKYNPNRYNKPPHSGKILNNSKIKAKLKPKELKPIESSDINSDANTTGLNVLGGKQENHVNYNNFDYVDNGVNYTVKAPLNIHSSNSSKEKNPEIIPSPGIDKVKDSTSNQNLPTSPEKVGGLAESTPNISSLATMPINNPDLPPSINNPDLPSSINNPGLPSINNPGLTSSRLYNHNFNLLPTNNLGISTLNNPGSSPIQNQNFNKPKLTSSLLNNAGSLLIQNPGITSPTLTNSSSISSATNNLAVTEPIVPDTNEIPMAAPVLEQNPPLLHSNLLSQQQNQIYQAQTPYDDPYDTTKTYSENQAITSALQPCNEEPIYQNGLETNMLPDNTHLTEQSIAAQSPVSFASSQPLEQMMQTKPQSLYKQPITGHQSFVNSSCHTIDMTKINLPNNIQPFLRNDKIKANRVINPIEVSNTLKNKQSLSAKSSGLRVESTNSHGQNNKTYFDDGILTIEEENIAPNSNILFFKKNIKKVSKINANNFQGESNYKSNHYDVDNFSGNFNDDGSSPVFVKYRYHVLSEEEKIASNDESLLPEDEDLGSGKNPVTHESLIQKSDNIVLSASGLPSLSLNYTKPGIKISSVHLNNSSARTKNILIKEKDFMVQSKNQVASRMQLPEISNVRQKYPTTKNKSSQTKHLLKVKYDYSKHKGNITYNRESNQSNSRPVMLKKPINQFINRLSLQMSRLKKSTLGVD
nr:protein PF3D7_1417600 isoform X2 [Hydra vulgaris]